MPLPLVISLGLPQLARIIYDANGFNASSLQKAVHAESPWIPSVALLVAFFAMAQLNFDVIVTLDKLWAVGVLIMSSSWMAVSNYMMPQYVFPAHAGLCLACLWLCSQVDYVAMQKWLQKKPTFNLFSQFCFSALIVQVVYVGHFLATTPINWQEPTGLLWGLFLTGVGQVAIVIYHWTRHFLGWFPSELHQPNRPPSKEQSFLMQAIGHFAKPSAFALMGAYLSVTYLLGYMPDSYYDLDAKVNWMHVVAQLAIADLITIVNHLVCFSVVAHC